VSGFDAKTTGEDFDWRRHADDVVIREQLAIAAYVNPNDDIAIRQANWPDDDAIIILAKSNAAALARALLRLAGSKAASAKQHRTATTDRRAAIEAALRADPSRSNRAIAAECGVSDKTVAAVRAEIGAECRAEFRSPGADSSRRSAAPSLTLLPTTKDAAE